MTFIFSRDPGLYVAAFKTIMSIDLYFFIAALLSPLVGFIIVFVSKDKTAKEQPRQSEGAQGRACPQRSPTYKTCSSRLISCEVPKSSAVLRINQ